MIDPNKLTEEISNLLFECDEAGIKRSIKKKKSDRIQFLRFIIQYLETGPTPEFIQKEIDRISNKINLIDKEYESYVPTQYFVKDSEKLKCYLKECEVPKLKMQLKALKFILNS